MMMMMMYSYIYVAFRMAWGSSFVTGPGSISPLSGPGFMLIVIIHIETFMPLSTFVKYSQPARAISRCLEIYEYTYSPRRLQGSQSFKIPL
jgi:hypothetical protein